MSDMVSSMNLAGSGADTGVSLLSAIPTFAKNF